MMIRKMTATFGKLNNDTVEFTPGMNLFCAPNESGKSTWCAFVCAMLYGIDSSERTRTGYIPDKTHYAPWSGAPMQGTLELSCELGDITLTRTTRLKNAPMREFSAVYTGTDTPVPGLTGQNAGERLTGVSKDVFCRSAFISQGNITVTGSPELEKRIASIVSTGDEATSYSDADEKLRRWLRKRRYNRRGLLPELESRIAEDQEKLENMSDTEGRIARLEEEINLSRIKCSMLESDMNRARQEQRKKSLELLNTTREEQEKCRTESMAADAELKKASAALAQSRFSGCDSQELETQLQIDTDKAARLEKLTRNAGSAASVAAIVFLVLAVVFATVYLRKGMVSLAVCAALTAAAGVILLLRFFRQRRECSEARRAYEEMLLRYGASSVEEIETAYQEYTLLLRQCGEASRRKDTADAALHRADELMQTVTEKTLGELDFAGGNSRAAQISRELSAERGRGDALSAQLASLRGRLSAVGDPLVLRSDISAAEEERECVEQEYSALTLAIDTLKAADTEIQSRFSPELGRLAASYMSEMTGGRYTDIFVSRDFSASVKTGDDSVRRPGGYLSAGTADQLYLALRLAVCALAMPKGESCPLIIDDALVNFDAARSESAVRLLEKIALDRQVILFTCK